MLQAAFRSASICSCRERVQVRLLEKLQRGCFRETIKLSKEKAVFVERGLTKLSCLCVSHKLRVSILNCDFSLLLDCPAGFGFPLAYERLSPLSIAELQRLADFLAADCAINPNKALGVEVLPASRMLLAALAAGQWRRQRHTAAATVWAWKDKSAAVASTRARGERPAGIAPLSKGEIVMLERKGLDTFYRELQIRSRVQAGTPTPQVEETREDSKFELTPPG